MSPSLGITQGGSPADEPPRVGARRSRGSPPPDGRSREAAMPRLSSAPLRGGDDDPPAITQRARFAEREQPMGHALPREQALDPSGGIVIVLAEAVFPDDPARADRVATGASDLAELHGDDVRPEGL